MYKYKIIIDTCLSCYKTKEIEYETEPTEQQIEDDVKDFVNENIEYFYERIE